MAASASACSAVKQYLPAACAKRLPQPLIRGQRGRSGMTGLCPHKRQCRNSEQDRATSTIGRTFLVHFTQQGRVRERRARAPRQVGQRRRRQPQRLEARGVQTVERLQQAARVRGREVARARIPATRGGLAAGGRRGGRGCAAAGCGAVRTSASAGAPSRSMRVTMWLCIYQYSACMLELATSTSITTTQG